MIIINEEVYVLICWINAWRHEYRARKATTIVIRQPDMMWLYVLMKLTFFDEKKTRADIFLRKANTKELFFLESVQLND